MINDNENEAENEKQITSIRPRPKYTKYEMFFIVIIIT